MHHLDEHDPTYLKDIFERHPVTPFLSVKFRDSVFSRKSFGLNASSFFRALTHDPINFLGVSMAEVRSSHVTYMISIASGLSVRVWDDAAKARSDLLWYQTRSETICPPPNTKKYIKGGWKAEGWHGLRYKVASIQPQLQKGKGSSSIFLYEPCHPSRLFSNSRGLG